MEVEMGASHPDYGKSLAAALKINPDHAPALYLQGRKAQLEGDYQDAESAFSKVVRMEPGNAKALGQLGMAQYHLGRFKEAEEAFKGVLAANASDYNTWYNLGELHLVYANGETQAETVKARRAEAMTAYLKALELNPDHAQAHYRVGVLLNGNGQYKEAIRHLEAALKRDSRHVPTLVQLSLAYENLKQLERARTYLNKAIELDPLNKVVLFKLRRLS
jgi:tetratricopeptide (TPR) repeat protein